ncbi:hypothetical protein HK101_010646, partial [Irineochytrium annulatum]
MIWPQVVPAPIRPSSSAGVVPAVEDEHNFSLDSLAPDRDDPDFPPVFPSEPYHPTDDADADTPDLYLDSAAAPIPPRSVVSLYAADLAAGLYGNPHSSSLSPSARLTTDVIRTLRRRVRECMGLPPRQAHRADKAPQDDYE